MQLAPWLNVSPMDPIQSASTGAGIGLKQQAMADERAQALARAQLAGRELDQRDRAQRSADALRAAQMMSLAEYRKQALKQRTDAAKALEGYRLSIDEDRKQRLKDAETARTEKKAAADALTADRTGFYNDLAGGSSVVEALQKHPTLHGDTLIGDLLKEELRTKRESANPKPAKADPSVNTELSIHKANALALQKQIGELDPSDPASEAKRNQLEGELQGAMGMIRGLNRKPAGDALMQPMPFYPTGAAPGPDAVQNMPFTPPQGDVDPAAALTPVKGAKGALKILGITQEDDPEEDPEEDTAGD